MQQIVRALSLPEVPRPVAIAHRVVHSGPNLTQHQPITPQVLAEIEQAASFAPLHQPIALEIIHEATRHFPNVENYACFDTIFHQSIPPVSSTYPIPEDLCGPGVRRYGFHGLSCESVIQQFQTRRIPGHASLQVPSRLIIAHLGSGASITAVRDGKSIDTTMGLTPCGGIMMGTRPGDLDPGLIFYLLRRLASGVENSIDILEQLLNKQSGLLALSGLSNNMHILRDAADNGNRKADVAIEAFVLQVRKVIGAYIALMGGVDAIVFTGGIGEHDVQTRSSVCDGFGAFGIHLNPKRNAASRLEARCITNDDSIVSVFVFPADEDRLIATHVARMHRQ
jgi:acetate kinase